MQDGKQLVEFFAYEEIGYPADSPVGKKLYMLDKLKEDCLGKPCYDKDGKTIGEIIKAEIEGLSLKVVVKMNDESLFKTELLTDDLKCYSISYK